MPLSSEPQRSNAETLPRRLLREWPLAFGVITATACILGSGHGQPENQITKYAFFCWLLAAMLGSAFRTMHHADELAERVGEPLGTLLLTLSAIIIEVALIVGQVMGPDADPTVARDTMFSVLMLILNGLVGIAILVAGLRSREQAFGMRASTAYLALILGLSMVGMVLPRLTTSAPGGFMGPYMQTFTGFGSLVIYGAFLFLQVSSHKAMFAGEAVAVGGAHEVKGVREGSVRGEVHCSHGDAPSHGAPWWTSLLFLLIGLGSVVGLAESLGAQTHELVAQRGLPKQAGGALVAVLILAPEGLTAIRSASRSNLQRTINILLGSALATLGLTIPAVLIMGQIMGVPIELGLEGADIALLAGTLMLCMLTLTQGKVTTMQALVHLLFFAAWIVLLFE